MGDNEPETILVVTPHPDDSESGAGGTIARWCAEGKKVVLVVCTNGDKGTGDRSIKPEDLARTREAETLNAAKAYGLAEVVFLREPDQALEDTISFREKIVRQIRIHKPRILLTVEPERPYIRHRDHSVAGRVTLDAVFPYARDHLAYPEHLEEGIEPHKVEEVWIFRPNEPDTYVDVTDYFETRQNALHSHLSQVGPRTDESDKRSRDRLAEVGKKYGVELAEQFKKKNSSANPTRHPANSIQLPTVILNSIQDLCQNAPPTRFSQHQPCPLVLPHSSFSLREKARLRGDAHVAVLTQRSKSDHLIVLRR